MNGPLHTPRPQLLVQNQMKAELDDFVESPKATVKVLFGDDSPVSEYGDPDNIRRTECQRLIEDAKFLDRLPM